MAGCISAMRCKASALHRGHWGYVVPSPWIATPGGGHAALVKITSRQCCCLLIKSSAGNQAAAWESPNSTTEVCDVVAPYMHGLLLIPAAESEHPFLEMSGLASNG